jgi:hypothetical protein
MNNMPGGNILELAVSSVGVIPNSSSTVSKGILVSDLCADFVTSTGPRAILFKSFRVQLNSPLFTLAGTDTGIPTNYVTAQLFSPDLQGDLVPLTKQVGLSNVNTTVMNARIPPWLLGSNYTTSSNTALVVVFRSASNLGATVTAKCFFTVTAQSSISPDIPLDV